MQLSYSNRVSGVKEFVYIVSLDKETEIRGIIIILLLISFFRRDVNTEKFGLG